MQLKNKNKNASVFDKMVCSLIRACAYRLNAKLLIEPHLQFQSLKGGCTGSLESTLIEMPHCWEPHVVAQFCVIAVV